MKLGEPGAACREGERLRSRLLDLDGLAKQGSLVSTQREHDSLCSCPVEKKVD